MLFRGEEAIIKVLMVLILTLSSIMAIVINKADLSGSKKLILFRYCDRFNKFFFIPGAIFLLVVQIVELFNEKYINIENSFSRFSIAFCALSILLLCFFRILPLTKQGLNEMKRKSITASKYMHIFRKLRASFMAIMVIVIFSYWLNYMFSR